MGPIEPEKLDRIQPSIVRDLDLEDHVILLAEMRTDVTELLALMDVVTLPSYREGMPRLPMEAGLMRKPVVATNIRGCREVIEDGRTGILVPPKDAGALAEAITYLLKSPDVAGRMGREAET